MIETETAVKLFAARNMPHSGEAERVRREDAIQLALRAAADVPLEVMRLCALGLQRAASLAGRSPRAASADVELAVALLETAFNGARSSLEAKLPSLTNAVHVTSIAAQVQHLSRDASSAVDAAKSFVQLPPA